MISRLPTVFVVVLVGVLGKGAVAWGGVCPKQPLCSPDTPVQATVSFSKAQPFVDESRSRQWIRKKSRERSAQRHPVGLTETHLVHRMTTRFTICSDKRRREQCVYLAEISLVVKYPDTKVYIAREYRPGSCEYQAIYQHEAEHVRILNAHQARFLPSFRAYVRHLSREIRPRSSKNARKAQKKIMRKLKRSVKKEIQRLERSLKSAHSAIDTAKNYAKVQKLCRNW